MDGHNFIFKDHLQVAILLLLNIHVEVGVLRSLLLNPVRQSTVNEFVLDQACFLDPVHLRGRAHWLPRGLDG